MDKNSVTRHFKVRLEEAYEPKGDATASIRSCMCCGLSICGMGGGGDYICIDCLDKMRSQSLGPRHAWVSVNSGLPKSGVTVLACYRNEAGMLRRIRAEYISAKTVESYPDDEFGEYDEDSDTYYDPEGWYEQIDNWGDYTAVAVCEGEITHWMPMPDGPKIPK